MLQQIKCIAKIENSEATNIVAIFIIGEHKKSQKSVLNNFSQSELRFQKQFFQ